MISRLILTILQLAIAWFAAPFITRYLPGLGQLDIFAFALVIAILVWVVGLLGSLVLKDVATPSSGTLTLAVIVALAGAALTLVPPVTQFVAQVVPGVPLKVYPLIGAVLGYMLRR